MRFLFHFYTLQGKAGIQRAICELSNALAADGDEVFIIVGDRGAAAYPLDNRISLIEIAHPEPRRFGIPGWPLRTAWALQQLRYVLPIARKVKPSIFVDHGTALGLLYPFRRLAGVPFVIQRNFPVKAFPNGRIMHKLLSYLKRSAVIVAVTESTASELRSYGHTGVYVIPNIVPAGARPAEYRHQNPKVGLLMGRAVPQKGFDIFLEALALQRIPGWQFIIVGPGVDKDPLLRDLVQRHRLQDVVSLLPATSDPYGQIAKASCVIMPSRYEGLPFVALESLAIGRPVIGANVDGLRDTVLDGVNGRLFPRGDVSKLSECLIATCRDEDKLSQYARNAPFSVQRFRAESVVRTWRAVATELSRGG